MYNKCTIVTYGQCRISTIFTWLLSTEDGVEKTPKHVEVLNFVVPLTCFCFFKVIMIASSADVRNKLM
jgi:hypothetical protein